MMNIDLKDIISPHDEYLIIEDGVVSAHSSGISDYLIDKNINLKIIYYFTRDSEIEFQITKGIKANITELIFDVAPTADINLKYSLEAGAEVSFLSVKNSTQKGKVRINTNISLAQDAYIKLNELASFPDVCELNNRIFLDEPGSQAVMKTVTLNTSGEKQIFSANIFHNSEATTSELQSYGIVANSSTLIISTDGIIKKGSAKVELRQNTKGLILDENSHISASPILEIEDFDVVASHGASIGAIDEEMLYYLMSRGIKRSDAEKLVISGFINPFLASITEEKLYDWIMSLINLNL